MSDLIERMQAQVHIWEAASDHRAIFLTCYAMMTDNMLKTVSAGGFEDGPWVTALTHCFADYYFDALALYEQNGKPPVWTYTFETACSQQAHVLQNLLLGVNAHICYDLIFALADSIQEEWHQLSEADRSGRQRDYFHVNEVIGATLDAVQDQVVSAHSQAMAIVDIAFGRLDEWMIHTLITRWRDEVWTHSLVYVSAPPEQRFALKERYAHQAEARARAIQGQKGILGILDLF